MAEANTIFVADEATESVTRFCHEQAYQKGAGCELLCGITLKN